MKKVLIVDDDLDIRDTLTRAIGILKYPVESVESSERALEKIEGFDIALVDWMMPYMDGLELIRKIKSQYPSIYVIMITAKTTQANALEALISGADDFIAKPVSLDDLEIRLHIADAQIELNKVKRKLNNLAH